MDQEYKRTISIIRNDDGTETKFEYFTENNSTEILTYTLHKCSLCEICWSEEEDISHNVDECNSTLALLVLEE